VRSGHDFAVAASGVEEPRSGRLATADADLPSLSHGHRRASGDSLGMGGSRAGKIASCDPFGCKHKRWKQQSAAARRRGRRTCAIAQIRARRSDAIPASGPLRGRYATCAFRLVSPRSSLPLSRERSGRRGGADTAASPLEQTPGRRPGHRSDGRQRGAPCSPPVTAASTNHRARRWSICRASGFCSGITDSQSRSREWTAPWATEGQSLGQGRQSQLPPKGGLARAELPPQQDGFGVPEGEAWRKLSASQTLRHRPATEAS
jgi:hypothetical protein